MQCPGQLPPAVYHLPWISSPILFTRSEVSRLGLQQRSEGCCPVAVLDKLVIHFYMYAFLGCKHVPTT